MINTKPPLRLEGEKKHSLSEEERKERHRERMRQYYQHNRAKRLKYANKYQKERCLKIAGTNTIAEKCFFKSCDTLTLARYCRKHKSYIRRTKTRGGST